MTERAGLRWPSLLPRTAQAMLRLPQGSRVRKAMLRRAAQAAFHAWMRGDFDLVQYIDDPEIETHVVQRSGTPIGFDTVYYGPEGHCRTMEIWNEAWRGWRGEIDEVIEEERDRVLIVARVYAEGSASGIELDEWGAVRYTFREGRIVRVDAAFDPDRARALGALGVADGTARAQGPGRPSTDA